MLERPKATHEEPDLGDAVGEGETSRLLLGEGPQE